MKKNRFIILRGPSGSGKSTIAKEIFSTTTHKTVLIQQDHYRFIFKPSGGGSKPNSEIIHKMIEHNCLLALEAGYDVILEGILSVKSYSDIIDRMINAHKGISFMFYFDISFEETLRRHVNRSDNADFGEEEMKHWYPAAHRSGHHLERIISENYSANQTVAHIKTMTGL